MLADEPAWREKAERVATLAKDVTEVMVEIGLNAPQTAADRGLSFRLLDAARSKGQRAAAQAAARRRLHRKEVPEAHLCCGWAGTYQVLQPELSRRLRDRKVANILSVQPDVIAAGNFGCVGNIAGGTTIPIVHTVELLDWATGGPRPAALARCDRMPA